MARIVKRNPAVEDYRVTVQESTGVRKYADDMIDMNPIYIAHGRSLEVWRV